MVSGVWHDDRCAVSVMCMFRVELEEAQENLGRMIDGKSIFVLSDIYDFDKAFANCSVYCGL